MKQKKMLRMGIDLAMTVLLFCQMAYLLIGEAAHEWTGAALFVLFLLHHCLNWRWFPALWKGSWGALRAVQTAVDLLLVFDMLGLMASAVVISREVFDFLPISGSMSFARILHMMAAYWGFLLMSLHLGLHWGVVTSFVRRTGTAGSPDRTRVLRLGAALLCCFGAWAFWKHNIADYLFLRSQFVFFDVDQPLALFFLEYLAMMGLWACIACCGAKALRRRAWKYSGKKAGE